MSKTWSISTKHVWRVISAIKIAWTQCWGRSKKEATDWLREDKEASRKRWHLREFLEDEWNFAKQREQPVTVMAAAEYDTMGKEWYCWTFGAANPCRVWVCRVEKVSKGTRVARRRYTGVLARVRRRDSLSLSLACSRHNLYGQPIGNACQK